MEMKRLSWTRRLSRHFILFYYILVDIESEAFIRRGPDALSLPWWPYLCSQSPSAVFLISIPIAISLTIICSRVVHSLLLVFLAWPGEPCLATPTPAGQVGAGLHSLQDPVFPQPISHGYLSESLSAPSLGAHPSTVPDSQQALSGCVSVGE